MKIAICDEELYYLEKIEELMREYFIQHGITGFQIDKYSAGAEFCALEEAVCQYDVLFLDICMENMSGMEIAKFFRKYAPGGYLVFVTTYADYAVEGYHVNAIRYLLKSNLEEVFSECMDCITEKEMLSQKYIEYNFREGKRRVSVEELVYIESQQHILVFVLKDEVKYTLYGKLDDIELDLTGYRFLRIHKSYLVNSRNIAEIRNYRVVLFDKKEFPIPRHKFRDVKEEFAMMRGEM